MIAIVYSIYSQSVHVPALGAGLMDNDAERYCNTIAKTHIFFKCCYALTKVDSTCITDVNQQCTTYMFVEGLKRMTTGTVAKRLTLSTTQVFILKQSFLSVAISSPYWPECSVQWVADREVWYISLFPPHTHLSALYSE